MFVMIATDPFKCLGHQGHGLVEGDVLEDLDPGDENQDGDDVVASHRTKMS